MARRRRKLKTPNKIAQYIRATAGSAADARRALQEGDCGEAVRSIAHAYEMRGIAEGAVRVMREQKGRKPGSSIVADRRLDGMIQTRNRIARMCSRSS